MAAVDSSTVGADKPDKRIFQHALALLGAAATPGAALHVGDDLVRDYLGARSAGMQAILVARDGKPVLDQDGTPVPAVSTLANVVI